VEISRAAGGEFPNVNDPRMRGAEKPAANASPNAAESAGVLSQVRRLVAKLSEEGVVREGRVEAARKLVESETWDSIDSAREAAGRILDEGI